MKMFWGLILEPGKKYEQRAESSFHLTMACLEPSTKTPTPNKSSITSVVLESNKTEFILCNLDQSRLLQQPLDCVFTEGESISFSVNGESKVHLSGYIMPDSDMEDSEDMFDMDGSESDSEAELMNMNEKKRKLNESKDGNKKVKFGDEMPVAAAKGDKKNAEKAKQPPAKGAKNDAQAKGNQKAKPINLGVVGDEDDDEDDDESMDSEDMKDLLDNFEDDEDDEDDDEDEDDESSPEAKKPVKPQQGKSQNQKATPGKQGGGQPGKQDGQKNQTPQGKKPFQQGGPGGKPWSGGKGKGGPPNNNVGKNQNSGKKGTPQGKKFGGNSPGSNKKPWAQKK